MVLEIPELKQTARVPMEDILRVEAHSNYCRIYLVNDSKGILVSKVLSWVEGKLPANLFMRVHRSHLVNRLHVKCITGHQHNKLELVNGETVSVSRRRMALIKAS